MLYVGKEELGVCCLSPLLPICPTGWATFAKLTGPSKLRMVLVNSRSIKNKVLLVHDLIVGGEFGLVCVIETSGWAGGRMSASPCFAHQFSGFGICLGPRSRESCWNNILLPSNIQLVIWGQDE